MENKPSLLVLAAGMGSRFGGLKQVEPVGPNGESILEYSVFDAIRAGFGKVVFIIRESFADEFKTRFSSRLQGKIDVEYVFQELHKLPEGYTVPEKREKPWGTGHAILMARNAIREPFAAINADDFYGFEAYRVMADFLTHSFEQDTYSMVGYQLDKTLSDFGTVSRGLCVTDLEGRLSSITETTKIGHDGRGVFYLTDDGERVPLTGKEPASMNFWGFKPSLFDELDRQLRIFLDEKKDDPKSELYIPSVVFELIRQGKATVKVLQSDSPWFGVTYQEDKPEVIRQIQQLIARGEYPEKLW